MVRLVRVTNFNVAAQHERTFRNGHHLATVRLARGIHARMVFAVLPATTSAARAVTTIIPARLTCAVRDARYTLIISAFLAYGARAARAAVTVGTTLLACAIVSPQRWTLDRMLTARVLADSRTVDSTLVVAEIILKAPTVVSLLRVVNDTTVV